MGFRKLLEMSDKIAREELGDYYIINSSRMDNYIQCLEDGAARIQELEFENDYVAEIISKLKDALEPFANYACDPPCGCHNCIAKEVLEMEIQN
jgi:hypothetical protein